MRGVPSAIGRVHAERVERLDSERGQDRAAASCATMYAAGGRDVGPPRDQQADRDGRIEVAAGDGHRGRDHDGQHHRVGQSRCRRPRSWHRDSTCWRPTPAPMNTRAKVPSASASERRSREDISDPPVSVIGEWDGGESRRHRPPKDQRRVDAAEAERIAEEVLGREVAALAGDVRQVAGGIGGLEVDRRRQPAAPRWPARRWPPRSRRSRPARGRSTPWSRSGPTPVRVRRRRPA